MESAKYSLNRTDLEAIGRGLLIALAGTVLTYAAEYVGKIDFGTATPIIVALTAVAINAGRKYLSGQTVQP